MDQHPVAPATAPGIEHEHERITIRTHGLQGILATVPYLLGFHPEQSLVPVLLDENRVVLTLRLDIEHLVEEPGRTREFLAEQVERTGATAVLFVGYTDRPDPAVTEALEGLSISFEAEALVRTDAPEVVDAVHVAAGRYRSVTCRDTTCCPDEGFDYAEVLSDPAAAEAVVSGLPALPNREDLRSCILPGSEEAGPEFDAALLATLEGLLDLDPADAAREMDMMLRRIETTGRPPADADLAVLTAYATHPSARDVATLRIHRRSASLWGDVWAAAARRTEGLAAVAPLGLVGIAAWARGDGALVCLCLEEAEQRLPEHGLVRLLEDVVDQGLHPDVWHRVRRESLEEFGPLGPASLADQCDGDEQAVG